MADNKTIIKGIEPGLANGFKNRLGLTFPGVLFYCVLARDQKSMINYYDGGSLTPEEIKNIREYANDIVILSRDMETYEGK